MYTRKQIKSVLQEWKSFLSEAKKAVEEKPYVVRIFDFDGTLLVSKSPEMQAISKNPYMAFLLNQDFIEKIETQGDKGGVFVPENAKKLISTADESYICSKIKSTGFDKLVPSAYDGTIRNIISGKPPDANFTNLFNFIKKNSPNELDISNLIQGFIKEVETEDGIQRALDIKDEDQKNLFFNHVKQKFINSKDIQEYLKISGVNFTPSDDQKVGTFKLIRYQQNRITRLVTQLGIPIAEENIVVTANIGEQAPQEIEGGGQRLTPVRQTSGKISDVKSIVERVVASQPEERKISFQVYDNQTSSLGEMVEGVKKGLPGYQGISISSANTEEEIVNAMREFLNVSGHYNIAGYMATISEDGVEYPEHIGRASRAKDTKDKKQLPFQRQFEEIKNGFSRLEKMLTGSGGRRKDAAINAFKEALIEMPVKQGVLDLYNSLLKGHSVEEKAKEEFSKDEVKFNGLIKDMADFMLNYDKFKKLLQTKLMSIAPTVQPSSSGSDIAPTGKLASRDQEIKAADDLEYDAAEEADDAFWLNMTPQERDNYERGLEQKKRENPNDPEVLGYNAWKKKQKRTSRGLAESVRRQNKPLLREFKLVLKSKK